VRYGVSWPAGHGRREYFSAGCLGWLILAPFIAAVYLIGFAALLLAWLAQHAWQGCRWCWRRWHERRPGGARHAS
jgi:hypothetical protein